MDDSYWKALDTISETGLYAVVVTAPTHLVPIASGYAKAISDFFADKYEDRAYAGLRLGQSGTPQEDSIQDSETNIVAGWVEGNAHPRRTGNEPPKGLVLYVERFDRIPNSALVLLSEAEELGLDVILVGAVDVTRSPNPKSLESFDTLRIINLPSNDGERFTTAEQKLRNG